MQVKYSKISRFEIKKIMKCFSQDLTTLQTAGLLDYNRNTINKYYRLFREIIYEYQSELYERLKMEGLVEVDESYFGAKRIRGYRGKLKRGRGTRKQPVFGILKRDGKVYTEIIPNCTGKVLQNIIESKVEQDTIIVSDGWKGYDGLVDMGYDKHYRVVHSDNEWSKGDGIHINGIENFRSFTKRRLNKFNGTKKNFHLHLKESEFRYGKTKVEIYNELIKLLKKHKF